MLDCDPAMMRSLQEMFLKKKKILNTQLLRKYLMQNGRLVDDKLTVPIALRKYFRKVRKDPYSNVQPRYNVTDKDAYKP